MYRMPMLAIANMLHMPNRGTYRSQQTLNDN